MSLHAANGQKEMDTIDDNVSIEIKSLETSLRGKFEALYSLSSDCCIYRIPQKMRQSNESLFTLYIVSIGPLHHGREELQAMEEHKIRYLQQFLQRTQINLKDFLIFIKNKEERLRNCYAETIPFKSQDFVEMILLDAVFLIEFLLRYSFRNFVTSGDRIFVKPRLIKDIRHDIWSVENQIPFFILEDLIELARTRMIDECYEGVFMSKLISEFSSGLCELLSIDRSLIEINFCEAKHFPDLLKRCIEPPDHELDIRNESIYYPTPPTITELHQAGVKFRVGSRNTLLDIRFDKGTLKIPKLRIKNVWFYLLNVRIFEGLHCKTNYMNDYALLLSLLVSSPKDAELLIQNGIIENKESVAASTFCQQLGNNGRMKYKKFYYTGLARDLNAYCKSPWHKWKANLKQNYFNTPWASISVSAAVILLLLTLTQTVCSIIAL
ncbi:hypothetical protein JRO89_XS10G0038200 [Xanthoceras sorbifolium]|uniref:Uncharacterized protein n=1 Tax=Xanthoceras sorbifolium TaxID=99658 RepID=A0ABQ8HHN0_9ROSI|nr:hypothetical protein JRO89_XS10G0038200 [Xanthoceras sorbifolium]